MLFRSQPYPNRPVKVIIPWPPGQATDLAARIVGEKLSQQLGQPFVMENKPGAGGAIGTEIVAKAAPDGYTLLAASSGPISIMPNLQKIPYDPLKDLAPVSLVALAPFALVVPPNFPASNAKEFLALVRANPGKYTFASSGTGATAHLFAELFNSMAQLKAIHVPYKGSAPALTDVMSGQIDLMFADLAVIQPHAASGKLRALALCGSKRTAAAPSIPTIMESGLKEYVIEPWFGVAGPANVPREIVSRLNQLIGAGLKSVDVQQRLAGLGYEAIGGSAEQFSATVKADIAVYAKIIKTAGIKADL